MLPPAVAGIGLLAALGPNGILGGGARRRRDRARPADGRRRRRAGLRRRARSTCARRSRRLRGASTRACSRPSRTLGAGEARDLRARRDARRAAGARRRRRRSPGAGRSGEFGATLMFAGSFQGVTQTAPLAIFARFATDFTGGARALGGARRRLRRRCCSRSSCSRRPRARRRAGCDRAAAARGRAAAARASTLDARARGRAGELPGPGRPLGRRQDARCCASSPGCCRPDARPRRARRRGLARHRARASTCRPSARRCGYVFQDYALFPHLSAWRNVAFGLTRLPRGASAGRGAELLERFGVGAPRRRAARRALRRRAPAGGAGAGAGRRARRAAARRAARGARRAHRRAAAARELAAILRAGGGPGAARHPRLRRGGAARATRSRCIDRGRIVQRGLAPPSSAPAPGVRLRRRLRRRRGPARHRPRPGPAG